MFEGHGVLALVDWMAVRQGSLTALGNKLWRRRKLKIAPPTLFPLTFLISPTSRRRYASELLKYTTRENHASIGRPESTCEETQNEDGLQDLQVSACSLLHPVLGSRELSHHSGLTIQKISESQVR